MQGAARRIEGLGQRLGLFQGLLVRAIVTDARGATAGDIAGQHGVVDVKQQGQELKKALFVAGEGGLHQFQAGAVDVEEADLHFAKVDCLKPLCAAELFIHLPDYTLYPMLTIYAYASGRSA